MRLVYGGGGLGLDGCPYVSICIKDGPGPQHYVKAKEGRAEHVIFIISTLDVCECLADCFGHSRGKSVAGTHFMSTNIQLDATIHI